MWATLRTDLKEFVSTVTDDTSQVLEKLDVKMQEAEDAAAQADRGLEPDGQVYDAQDGPVVVDVESNFEATGIVSTPADERLRRMGDPETFLVPLVVPQENENDDTKQQGEDNQVEEKEGENESTQENEGDENESNTQEEDEYEEERDFLEAFDIDSKTEEIATLLQEHPDTLQAVFEELVPTQVPYEEFWQRFYFRCNVERIEREWALERERARQARAKALEQGIRSVKSLFGGAVQAVSKTLEGAGGGDYDDDAVPESPYQFNATQQPHHASAAGISTALFGAGGRPPFVMNTAVSEEDDDEEDEDEEEELGWDDDDDEFETDDEEEEEEVEESYVEGESEEQIEFSATLKEEMEQLRQELAQAIEERDQLHQTVEMQSKAIADLQQKEAQPVEGESKEIVEKLKMTLFEKDAELAALKASLDDTHEDDKEDTAKKDAAKIAATHREMERLRLELSEKQSEMEQKEKQLKSCAAELEQLRSQSQNDKAALEQLRSQSQNDKAALASSQTAKSELETQLASFKDALEKSESQRTEAEADSASLLMAAKEETAAAQATIAELTAKVDEFQGNLEFTTRRADHLEQELAAARKELEQKETEKVVGMHSPVSSASSGVKVPPLDAHAAGGAMDAVNDNDDDDDDAWGEDWSDDE